MVGDLFPLWDDMREHAPKMIAELENIFPGNTWVIAGRDVDFFGDVLQGFHLSLGQPERVIRLEVSAATFRTKVENPHLRILQKHGLVSNDGQPLKNFTFIDVTRWASYLPVQK